MSWSAVTSPINPGMVDTFRWLSRLAQLYESYTFESLEFEYVPSVAATTAGSVQMAADYDAVDIAPQSESDMLSYEGALMTPVWAPARLVCPKPALQKIRQRFIRHDTEDVPDLRVTDVGNFVYAAAGMADTSAVGALFVKYRVRFFTPQLALGIVLRDCSMWVAAATKTIPMPNTAVISGTAAYRQSDTAVRMRSAGNYLLTVFGGGTGMTADSVLSADSATTAVVSLKNVSYLVGTSAAFIYIVECLHDLALLNFDWSNVTTLINMMVRIARYSRAD